MAVTALHTAASGLSALATEIDVISNNLANVNTAGFKSQRVNFEDLLYQHKKQPGVENANGDHSPAGLQVGLGVRIANTQYDFEQGAPMSTGRDFDVAISGAGFFIVDILEEEGGGIGYTRSGNFFVNREGDLVLGNSDGPRIDPGINVPEGATSIGISADGVISYILPGDVDRTEGGQLELATFINPAGLKSIGGNIFIATDASGPANQVPPGEGGTGTLLHKYLESSNVDPVSELITLIKAQRAFEMNSKTIQAADEVMQVIGQLRR